MWAGRAVYLCDEHDASPGRHPAQNPCSAAGGFTIVLGGAMPTWVDSHGRPNEDRKRAKTVGVLVRAMQGVLEERLKEHRRKAAPAAAWITEREERRGLIRHASLRRGLGHADRTMYPMHTTAGMRGRSGGDGRTPSNAKRDAYVRQSAVLPPTRSAASINFGQTGRETGGCSA